MQIIDFSEIKASCSTCSLHEVCLPKGLSSDEVDKLEKIVRHSRPLQKGSNLFKAGDKLSSLHAVRSGSIKLYAIDTSGNEQIIGFYLAGELLGFDGIDTHAHKCTAVALETSTICSFPYTNLIKISQQIPSLHEQLFHLIGREISHENNLLLTISKKNAVERIATFLLSLSRRFNRLGYAEKEFNLSMSRKDIGNYLGLEIETVSRAFTSLQKQNIIAIDKKFIKILEMDTLHHICIGKSIDSISDNSAA